MLDIGRGLRRNARIPAAEVRSFITAVDLTAEFWRVGALLNDQTQLANRVTGTPDGCPGGRGIGVGLSPTPRLPPQNFIMPPQFPTGLPTTSCEDRGTSRESLLGP